VGQARYVLSVCLSRGLSAQCLSLKQAVNGIYHVGGAIGLNATQISFAINGVSGVRVSFTPNLQNGYRVTVGNGPLVIVLAPPVTLLARGMGVVNISVDPLSRHYPIPAIQDTVILNGEIVFST
jgi:hypothetical protein